MGEASPDINKTLESLHLNRNCHITLLDNNPNVVGMLKKASKFVTWGEITEENILLLLKERGRLSADKKLDEEHAQKIGYKTLNDLAKAIHKLEAEFQRLPEIKPVFRAHPPRKGYKGRIKKSFNVGGATGYRGEAINKLIERMV